MDRRKYIAAYIPEMESMTVQEIKEELCSKAERHDVSCVNWKEYPYAPQVGIRIAFSDKSLAVMFDVKEDHLRGVNLDNNGPVWEDSCVEMFIDDPMGEGYYNFESSCIGTYLAAHRMSRTDCEHFDEEKMARIRCESSLPHEVTDIKGEGLEWTLVEIVPFELIGLTEAPASLRMNFYKCGDGCAVPHYLSWSPIGLAEPNFHCPEFFGETILSK